MSKLISRLFAVGIKRVAVRPFAPLILPRATLSSSLTYSDTMTKEVDPKHIGSVISDDTLMMRNISFDATIHDIENFFHPITLKKVSMIRRLGVFSGNVVVTFNDPEDLTKVLERPIGSINGRNVVLKRFYTHREDREQ